MNRRGFTLLELLVAMGLSLAVVALLSVLVARFSETWRRASGQMTASMQARAALDQLAADLQGAFVRDDGQAWLAVRVRENAGDVPLWDNAGAASRQKPAALSLRLEGANIADERFGVGGCWLRFFSAQRMADQPAGVPVALGYQIVRRRLNAASEPRYFLHRAEVRPVRDSVGIGVWESGCNLAGAAALPYAQPSAENSGALGDPASVARPSALGTVLADSVVDFGVRLFVRDGSGARMVYPRADARAEYQAGVESDMPWPAEAEIVLRVLTLEGAARIADIEAVPSRVGTRPAEYATDAEWWWAVVEQHSKVYVRRVELIARP